MWAVERGRRGCEDRAYSAGSVRSLDAAIANVSAGAERKGGALPVPATALPCRVGEMGRALLAVG